MEGIENVDVRDIAGELQLVLTIGPGTRPGLKHLRFEKREAAEPGGQIYRNTDERGFVVVLVGDSPDPDATSTIIHTQDGFEAVEHPRVLSAEEANLADPEHPVVASIVWARIGVDTLPARDITGVTPRLARELLPGRFSLARRGNDWTIVTG